MPTNTPKLGLPVPVGGETAGRQAIVDLASAIDSGAASQDQANEPLYLKSVTYDAGNNRLTLTLGIGRANFNGTLVAKNTDSTVYVAAPLTNTTYYVYLKSDGTFTSNTAGAKVAGGVLLWSVATGSALTTLTTTDLRGQLPGAATAAHEAADDPHTQYATDTDLANHTVDYYTGVTGKPTSFAPSSHHTSHATGGTDALTAADIGAVGTSVIGQPNGVASLNGSGKLAQMPTAADVGAVATTVVGQPNGVAGLDGAGKVPNAQMPPLAITDTFPAASQAEMLALAAQIGDVCVRTDLSKSYILKVADPSILANWQELLSPPNAVASVNGKTGVVNLTPADVGAVPTAAEGSAGGTEPNKLAQTDNNGGVGRANALKDGGGAYRTATTPGGNGPNLVAITDSTNGAVGRANAVMDGGATPAARTATALGGTQANSVAITDASGRVGDSNKLVGMAPAAAATASTVMQRDANGRSQIAAPAATGDIARVDEVWTAIEESLVIESALPVTGSEPTQIQGGMGPAIEFTDGVTQSVVFTRRWPFGATVNLKVEIMAAMDTSYAGNVRLQVGWQANGGGTTNVGVTVTALASTTGLVTVDLGQIIAAADLSQGCMLTLTISRLGGDALDTHTGKLRIYHTRLKRG